MWNKLDRPVICLFCHDRHLKLLFPGLWQKICFSRSTPRCNAILKSHIYEIHRDVWERVLNYPTSREPVQGQSRTSVEQGEGKLPCIVEKLKAHFVNALKNIERQQTIHSTQTPEQQSLPTLINLATRSQTWTLFRWNYNIPSACHDLRQEKLTS